MALQPSEVELYVTDVLKPALTLMGAPELAALAPLFGELAGWVVQLAESKQVNAPVEVAAVQLEAVAAARLDFPDSK